MIKIKTADLKSFLAISRKFKQNKILPVLDFFKIECVGDKVILTDTNKDAFIAREIPGEFDTECEFLVERNLVWSLVSNTSSEYLTITQKGNNKIKITDDNGDTNASTDDVSLYLKMPEFSSCDKIKLNLQALTLIRIAAKYCAVQNIEAGTDNLAFVHIVAEKDNSFIFASDRWVFYSNYIEDEKFNAIIRPSDIELFDYSKEAYYSSNKNWVFYDCGTTVFAFVKSEAVSPNIKNYITGIVKDNCFTILKEDVLLFCNRSNAINPGKSNSVCSLKESGENAMEFLYENVDFEKSTNMVFNVVKQGTLSDFKFNATVMVSMIEPLPYKSITFVRSGDMYYLYNDVDDMFVGIIMGLKQ